MKRHIKKKIFNDNESYFKFYKRNMHKIKRIIVSFKNEKIILYE